MEQLIVRMKQELQMEHLNPMKIGLILSKYGEQMYNIRNLEEKNVICSEIDINLSYLSVLFQLKPTQLCEMMDHFWLKNNPIKHLSFFIQQEWRTYQKQDSLEEKQSVINQSYEIEKQIMTLIQPFHDEIERRYDLYDQQMEEIISELENNQTTDAFDEFEKIQSEIIERAFDLLKQNNYSNKEAIEIAQKQIFNEKRIQHSDIIDLMTKQNGIYVEMMNIITTLKTIGS